MPTYDSPRTEIYIQPASAFGATTESTVWQTPAYPAPMSANYGFVRDIDVATPSADMVGTTTVPEITVGVSAGATEYARFRLGTTATAGYTTAQGPRRASRIASAYTGHVELSKARIPASANFFISRVAGTGGSPAGNAVSRVIIDWF
jgi:hypothetical protein